MDIGDFEQDLAANNDQVDLSHSPEAFPLDSDSPRQASQLEKLLLVIADPKVIDLDKLKLCLMYGLSSLALCIFAHCFCSYTLRYEKSSNNPIPQLTQVFSWL